MVTRVCDLCGGTWNVEDHAIRHAPQCPNHADAIDDTPVEPIRPAPVASIAKARFEKASADDRKPEHALPRDALVVALDYVDSHAPGEGPTHIMVLIGRDAPENRGASGTTFYQAGTYRHHAQMGLCLEAMHMIRESGHG